MNQFDPLSSIVGADASHVIQSLAGAIVRLTSFLQHLLPVESLHTFVQLLIRYKAGAGLIIDSSRDLIIGRGYQPHVIQLRFGKLCKDFRHICMIEMTHYVLVVSYHPMLDHICSFF